MAAYYQPLTLRTIASAYAFLRDCEDDDPAGLFGENGPARRLVRYCDGAHVEGPHDETGRSTDRVDSFEDEIIARLDGEAQGDEDESDYEATMADFLDNLRILEGLRVEAEPGDEPVPSQKAPVSVPVPPSLDRLPRGAGMGRRKAAGRARARVSLKRAA